MNPAEVFPVQCPHCGEGVELLVDCSVAFQDYIEDCEVCCRPISITVRCDPDHGPSVSVRREED